MYTCLYRMVSTNLCGMKNRLVSHTGPVRFCTVIFASLIHSAHWLLSLNLHLSCFYLLEGYSHQTPSLQTERKMRGS